ncbi:MAG: P1 family peptidase [Actinobacteria bacterium]|nr:P1 family peptidase [Actinomycetota bacterium]
MRARLRDLGLALGELPVGSHNAITDVPGVAVGHATVVRDEPAVLRTGVTMVVPRPDVWTNHVFAAWYNFSGNGEMTGLPWIEESGLIGAPIGITNTHQVGLVRDFIVKRAEELGIRDAFHLPVVAETWDGWLSEIGSFGVTEDDARAALDAAAAGPVAEGCVGGGTGMICHGFKGGIGTSSRVVDTGQGRYTVGVLVQANYGRRVDLRVDGRPVGRLIGNDRVPSAWEEPPAGGSIIVIAATDAPLLPIQCRRLAKRITVGLGRVGGYGEDSSGDIFLVFSTGNDLPAHSKDRWSLTALTMDLMNGLFYGVAEATEEAILNALCTAETTTGQKGRTAHALPHDLLWEALKTPVL